MWIAHGDDIKYDITNFIHRSRTLYDEAISGFRVKHDIETRDNKGLSLLGIRDFSFTDLWSNAVYNFLEEVNYLAYPAPLSTDTVYIGSHCPVVSALPIDLKEYLDDEASKGTIYIAFGNNVQWAHAPPAVVKAFKYFMQQLYEYRILFVYNGDSFEETPPHVKILRWAPQFDILSHNKTLLFISHGGLKSVKEAICSKKPVLYLPLFAEQTHNAAMAVKLGFARSVSKLSLNGEKMVRLAHEMLTNSQYRDTISRLHDIFVDRPVDSLAEAVFWTNRALRLGARKPTFKRRGIFLSSISYFYLPQLFFIFLVVAISCKA
ncbi:unnamed protein product [Toxocara canis]|nr:unnamed protein product [Toxocara canis]